jgi:hypothetical protein
MTGFPPSLGKVPGIGHHRMEENLILGGLATAIRRTGPNIDAVSGARYIYSHFLATKVDVSTKRKKGMAPQISVAKQLKQIASGAATLAKRLEHGSDGNVFDAWVMAADDNMPRQDIVDQWVALRQLLETTRERAQKAGKTAEQALKLWRKPGQKGRPADDVARLTAIATLEIYERATGQLGPRSVSRDSQKPVGAFHRLLTQVFETLGIKASPDATNMWLQAELKKLRRK